MKCWLLILTAKETVNRDMRLLEFLYILLFSVFKIVYDENLNHHLNRAHWNTESPTKIKN